MKRRTQLSPYCLTVTAAGAATLEVVIAPDAGEVQGTVSDKDRQPVAGATIVLVPDQRSRADLFKSSTSDQNGHFELASVTPGGYKLFAWDDVEPGAWNDPDFLKDYEKQGEKTVLGPKSRSNRKPAFGNWCGRAIAGAHHTAV